MKTLLTSLLIIFSVNLFAQKLKRDEKDPFYKADVKETSSVMLAFHPGESIRVHATASEGVPVLWFWIQYGSIFTVSAGDRIILLLEDGNTVNAECVKGGVSDYSPGAAAYYYLRLPYKLRSEDMDALNKSPLKGIRIEFADDTYLDYKSIRSKKKWAIRDMLQIVKA
jgi:hypothetical protein